MPTSSRTLPTLAACLALGAVATTALYHHLSHAGLDEAAFPPALAPAEVEALRDRCRAEPHTCGELGAVYLRAWAERVARTSQGPLGITVPEAATAFYLYAKACGAGNEAACGIARDEPTPFIQCPTRRVRLVDEAGVPVVGVSTRAECRDEAGATQVAFDTSDLDGWAQVTGYRIMAGGRDFKVADSIVISARAWHPSPTGGGDELELVPGEVLPPVPLRQDPWASLPASDVTDGWWWRQADPVSDQRRAPWIRLDLPGATGGTDWPDPPPRVFRLDAARVDGGIVQAGIDGHAQVLVAITANTIVALEWEPTGFDYPYVFRRGG